MAAGSPLRASDGDARHTGMRSGRTSPSAAGPPKIGERRSLEQIIGEASGMITRLDPFEAFRAAKATSLIVDIRAQDARDRRGVIPGSLHIPRTVLEWRAAPDSAWRSPYLGDLDQQLILICDDGYSSILAARNLVELGFRRASDVIGGFEAWKRGELPVVPCRPRSLSGELPGMGPPEPRRSARRQAAPADPREPGDLTGG